MIVQSYYLSNYPINKILNNTNLSEDELCIIVGKFAKHSRRSGMLRGEYVRYADGSVIIRHHFNKKVLWRME